MDWLREGEEQGAIADTSAEAAHAVGPLMEHVDQAAELVATGVEKDCLAFSMQVVFEPNDGHREGFVVVIELVDGDLVELGQGGAGDAEGSKDTEHGEELGLQLFE